MGSSSAVEQPGGACALLPSRRAAVRVSWWEYRRIFLFQFPVGDGVFLVERCSRPSRYISWCRAASCCSKCIMFAVMRVNHSVNAAYLYYHCTVVGRRVQLKSSMQQQRWW